MQTLKTRLSNLILVEPVPERDAPYAYGWFSSASGRDTLLKMGNAPHEITAPSLEQEHQTIEEFLELEAAHKQLTWMIRYDDITIGATWITLIEEHGVNAPSIHILIGDPSFRGKGIGKATIETLRTYVHESLGAQTIFSRHLTNNAAICYLMASCGFVTDGESYVDDHGLEWQNITTR